jgi:hypothetical protein
MLKEMCKLHLIYFGDLIMSLLHDMSHNVNYRSLIFAGLFCILGWQWNCMSLTGKVCLIRSVKAVVFCSESAVG